VYIKIEKKNERGLYLLVSRVESFTTNKKRNECCVDGFALTEERTFLLPTKMSHHS
jgi:hypothetical protein